MMYYSRGKILRKTVRDMRGLNIVHVDIGVQILRTDHAQLGSMVAVLPYLVDAV